MGLVMMTLLMITLPQKYYWLGIHLQWAFARLKFEEYLTAAYEIQKAYSLLEENQENLEKLKLITNRKVIIEGAKYGYRATTQDHLPLVGKTKHNIYVNIGHGSRGSSSAPIGAQFVCDLMSGSPPIFGKKISEALDPERFKGKS